MPLLSLCVKCIIIDKYIGGGYVEGSASLDRPEFSGDNKDQRAYLHWCSVWLGSLLVRSSPDAKCCLFTDWRQLPTTTDAIQCGGWTWRGIFVWDKTEAARPQKGWFRNQCEYVVWGSLGPIAQEGECLPGLFRQSVLAEGKEHIAGKPVTVMEQVVAIAAKHSLILDPFCGSGTTLVAAAKLGRHFLGFEISPEYCEIARKRLALVEAQPTLFEKKPEQIALLGEENG